MRKEPREAEGVVRAGCSSGFRDREEREAGASVLDWSAILRESDRPLGDCTAKWPVRGVPHPPGNRPAAPFKGWLQQGRGF